MHGYFSVLLYGFATIFFFFSDLLDCDFFDLMSI